MSSTSDVRSSPPTAPPTAPPALPSTTKSPCIAPASRPLARRPGEVQFGLLPDGPILEGLTPVETGLLTSLDGSRTLADSFAHAAASGVAPARWRELLDLLADLGILEAGTHERAGRAARQPGCRSAAVVVDGDGPLAAEIAELLARSVRAPVWSGARVDQVVSDPDAPRPVVVVLVGSPALHPQAGDVWLARGTPHLPVVPGCVRATVGPLVDRGHGPCLWCLDLHRADRDDAWPTVLAQVCGDPEIVGVGGGSPPAGQADTPGLSAALSQILVGSVAAFAQSVLAGHRPPTGVSIDLSLPWPRMDYRRWVTHPLCHRHRPAGQLRLGSEGASTVEW